MRNLIPPQRRRAFLLTTLAAVVTAVLLHGAFRRRTPSPGAAKPAPAQQEAPALRADLEKTPLSYLSDYWRQLGSRARAKLLLVGPRRTPALVVGPDLAVSTIEALDSGAGAPSGSEAAGSPGLLAADAAAGLALYELSPPIADRVFRPADSASLHPGMLVAGVTVDAHDRLRVMPGHLISVEGPSLSGRAPVDGNSLDAFVPLTPSTRVAAIVDLDGNLVGAAFSSHGVTRLLSAASLLKAVERLRARPSCRSLEVADLGSAVRKLLGLESGVAVERVHREAFRPLPSIRAGDVLIEWNRHKVSDAAAFQRLYDAERPGALVPYVVRRGRRVVRGNTVMPGRDCRPLGEPPVVLPKTGLTLAWDSPATDGEATKVAAGSPAQTAGIQPGDRILGVDGSKAGREDVLRGIDAFEKQGRSVLLTLRRGDRIKLVALSSEGR